MATPCAPFAVAPTMLHPPRPVRGSGSSPPWRAWSAPSRIPRGSGPPRPPPWPGVRAVRPVRRVPPRARGSPQTPPRPGWPCGEGCGVPAPFGQGTSMVSIGDMLLLSQCSVCPIFAAGSCSRSDPNVPSDGSRNNGERIEWVGGRNKMGTDDGGSTGLLPITSVTGQARVSARNGDPGG